MSTISVKYYSYPKSVTLDSVDLLHRREELEKLYKRVESFRACTFHIVDQDWGFLPEADYDAIDAADDRLLRLSDYIEGAIESIDEARKALETLENDIYFAYEEVDEVIKKKGAV